MSSRRSFLLIATALIVVSSAPPGVARESEQPRVTARLVADTDAVEPGSVFRLGVRLEVEDGWHIYWRYPGEAGLATVVDFELPPGFVGGELEWPLPMSFTQSEGIPGYGYEGSVVLATRIETPRNAVPRSTTVGAEVSWLACRGVCVLGSATLESALADIAIDPAFGNWTANLPRPFDDEDAPFSLSVTGGLAGGVISHWIRWHQSPQTLEWFPEPSQALEVKDVRIQTRGGLTRIDAEIRRRKGASGSADLLSSLVVVNEEDGVRRGWKLSTELKKTG